MAPDERKARFFLVSFVLVPFLNILQCNKCNYIQKIRKNWCKDNVGQRYLGSLRKDNDDGNGNGKKAIALDKQNNNYALASRFFVHFSAVVARIQRETD